MKKIYILLTIIIIPFLLSAQQLLNANFETWTDSHYAEDWNSYEFGSSPFIFYTASRSTDAAFGTYAAKLETVNAFVENIPGIILLGNINFDTFMPEGGSPFSSRPAGIVFSYKYTPSGGDGMLAFAVLTKWNTVNNSRDTIAGAFFQSNETQAAYLRKSLPIYYRSADEPDTINVGFISSNEAPQAGSVLFIDSVEMSYELVNYPTYALPASNITGSSFVASWAPIPYAVSYDVELAYDEAFVNQVEGYNPLNVLSTGYNSSVEISGLQTNRYFYRVKVNYSGDVSEYSNIITVPLPAQALDATQISGAGFTANWDEAAGADNFLLTVARDANFNDIVSPYNDFAVGANLYYVVGGLSPETNYFYKLKTVYQTDISVFSNTVQLTTAVASAQFIDKINFEIFSINNNLRIVNYSKIDPYMVCVYDISGKIVYENVISDKIADIFIAQKGFYIVKIINSEGFISKKIVIY